MGRERTPQAHQDRSSLAETCCLREGTAEGPLHSWGLGVVSGWDNPIPSQAGGAGPGWRRALTGVDKPNPMESSLSSTLIPNISTQGKSG